MMTVKDGKDYISQVKELIIEYTKRLNRDLSFQNIEDELRNPAEKYTAPEGELLVAVDETDNVIGMVAYHRHSAERCEMKRLYVKPETRGMHLGDLLVKEILEHAEQAGYKEMVLDTIIPLKAAIGLYKKNGFKECEPYYNNPMDDVIYMKKEL
jgi:ribosomal protein S18 acetylase RimI-like enzyme